MNNTCSVCFCEENNFIKCYNSLEKYCCTTCESKICFDCFPIYLKSCLDNNLLPLCISNGCGKIFPVSIIKKLGEKHLDMYYKCIYRYLKKSDGEKVNKSNEFENMIQKLRKEKTKFIQDNFPKAIQMTVNIVFKNKLQKLERDKILRANEKIKNMKKMCFNLSCKGFLDNNKCTLCDTIFCKDCEKPIKRSEEHKRSDTKRSDTHECKEEDLESIKFIKSLSKCPSCNFAVQKSEGCDSMKCTNCDTNFSYSTGEMGGVGNNHNVQIKVRQNYKLSQEFNNIDKDILVLLKKFEDLKPKNPNSNTYFQTLKLIFKSDKTSNEEESLKVKDLKIKAVNQYIYYLQLKYSNKKYVIIESNIEEHLRKKDITLEFLEKCLVFQ